MTVDRVILRRAGKRSRTSFGIDKLVNGRPSSASPAALADLADAAFLRAAVRPALTRSRRAKPIRIADLFSGCGAMSLGVEEAARALGYRFRPVLAVDTSPVALEVYKKNFPTASVQLKDIRRLLRARLRAPLSNAERALKKMAGRIDIALAGPPCQGHSDLNNHTRRRDPKNSLYYRVARFAAIVRPTHLVIENVPAVLLDHGRVIRRTKRALEQLGYRVDDTVVRLADLGVPQTRRRHVMVASLRRKVSLENIVRRYRRRPRCVRWAIGDLVGKNGVSIMNRAAKPTRTTERRMNYLFDHKLYDLPNTRRPPCHRSKAHTYLSVYGRLRWRRPSQTVTSGFTCMGQGRFVHPGERRTLTPREAARLQFIPDFFSFDEGRGVTAVAEMIGNAVPPKLTYVLALELLR